MPLPPSVFIALPAVTQLLTSGAALNASRRYTEWGPPPIKVTGMSRPIAADGTISDSTLPAALAIAGEPAVAVMFHNTTASRAEQIIRSRFDRVFTSTSFAYDRACNRRTVNHSSGQRGKIRTKFISGDNPGASLRP